jgi:hypothetical protein
MKLCLVTVCFAALVVSAALAQQKKAVPPPPKPADEGPSLEVTMKFIQDKLNDVGTLNFVVFLHDNVAGTDLANRNKLELSNVAANAGACRISYHVKWELNGAVTQDIDAWFPLKDVGDILVMPIEQAFKAVDTAAGHPGFTYRSDPPLFVLQARRTNSKAVNEIDFADEQIANRVAKAMVHAVELCGGGAKPEPF